MRFSESTRFPHPVLGLGTGDFVVGKFSVEIDVKRESFYRGGDLGACNKSH